MKIFPSKLAFTLVVFFTCYSQASAYFKICNNTPYELWSAFGYTENSEWYAAGWYKTNPGGCKVVYNGKLRNRYYYHLTENKSFDLSYSSFKDSTFCVDPEDAFGPAQDSSFCPSGFEKEPFRKIDVGNAKTYTLTLNCSKCKNPFFKLDDRGLTVNYLHTALFEGVPIRIPVSGFYAIDRGHSRLDINFRLDVSLFDLQSKLTSILAPQVNQKDECGDRVRLQNARLRPTSSAVARVEVNIDYERWYCTYAKVPEFRGIKLTMKNRRTSKNRVFETGLSGTMLLHPSVSGRRSVRLSAEVTRVRVRNDLARFLKSVMQVNLRNLAQRELERNLGDGGAIVGAVPRSLQRVLSIDTVKFSDRGGGELGVVAEGSISISLSDAKPLCGEIPGICRTIR